ncbi:MAG: alpha/beta fold hydrolase [Candidatus Micrarchaeia archaeon]
MDYKDDFEEGYFTTRHGNIFYRHHPGTGSSIFFLHGFGANTMVWQKLVQYIDYSFDVYLIDLLGHGNSDAPKIDYTISVQCESLLDVVGKAKVQNPSIFGHSYGGWVAAYFEYLYNLSKNIILEDPAGISEYFTDILKSTDKDTYKNEMVERALRLNSNKEYVLRSIVENDFKGEQLDSAKLAKITKPVLILWGSKDQVVDTKYASVLASHIAGSRVSIIEGAGHDAHFTHAQKVAEELESFINYSDKLKW